MTAPGEEEAEAKLLPVDLRSNRVPASPPGYEIIRRLGGGGMGDVFLARDVSAERLIALKFLRSAGNPTAVERFLTEVRALARIDHPHIVRVYSTDFYSLTPFFAMEYVAGGTLADRIHESGPLPIREAVRILAAVSRAIQVAHEAQVLHRDLKPSNILLDFDGDPRVADFGLAKRIDCDDQLTLTSHPIGTPSFMPPEQVSRRYGELSAASDVYSLGATLFYALSGRAPHEGESSAEIVVKLVSGLPERLRAIRPEVPAGLEAIVMKCLEKCPQARYPSAAELADDLDRFLAGQKEHAPRLTVTRRLKQQILLRGKLAGASGLIALLVAITTVTRPWSLFSARQSVDMEGSVHESQPPPSIPNDPCEQLRQEIATGQPVQLLTHAGKPRWVRWPVISGDLESKPEGGGTACLASREAKVLIVLNDPGVDRYRLSVELCERQKLLMLDPVTHEPMNPAYSTAGLIVGFASRQKVDGRNVHAMEMMGFSEYDRNGKAPFPRDITLREFMIDDTSPLVRGLFQIRGPHFRITPTIPGPPWRRMTIEVTPEGIKALEPLLNNSMTVGQIQRSRQQLAQYKAKEMTGPLPEWSPRLPIGIWCYDSEIAFRDFTIQVLP